MSNVQPFTSAASATINAGATDNNRAALAGAGNTLYVFNSETVTVWVRTGNSTVTVGTSDFPVPAGATAFLSIPDSDTHVAATTAQATTSITYIRRGYGG